MLALGVVTVGVGGDAIARGVSNGKKVTVAHGRFAHRTWSLAVQGQRHQRCFELQLDGPTQSSASGTCGPDRRPPLWSRVMGISDLNDSASVELDITRNRVRRMRLKIGHPKSNRPDQWTHVKTRRMTRHQAHKASVRRNFRFAVLHSRGNLCVKQVILFNRDGDRIDKMHVPCEF